MCKSMNRGASYKKFCNRAPTIAEKITFPTVFPSFWCKTATIGEESK